MVAEMNIADNFEYKFNIEAVFSAKNPAFGMSADAANLAAFYEFLVNDGRTRDGNQLVSERLIKSYIYLPSFQSWGVEAQPGGQTDLAHKAAQVRLP